MNYIVGESRLSTDRPLVKVLSKEQVRYPLCGVTKWQMCFRWTKFLELWLFWRVRETS